MSRTHKDTPHARTERARRRRDITVRAVRRNPIDTRRLGRAIIRLALAEADANSTADNTSSTQDDVAEPDDSRSDADV